MPAATQYRWDAIQPEQMSALITRQYIVGSNLMLARLALKKDARVPVHRHRHEQVSQVVEGALMFGIEGKQIMVRAGEILCIPPHIEHEVLAMEDSVAVDIFNPPREDWINGEDAYLRAAADTAGGE